MSNPITSIVINDLISVIDWNLSQVHNVAFLLIDKSQCTKARHNKKIPWSTYSHKCEWKAKLLFVI